MERHNLAPRRHARDADLKVLYDSVEGFAPVGMAAMAYEYMRSIRDQECMLAIAEALEECCQGDTFKEQMKNAAEIVRSGGPGTPQYEAAQIARKASQYRNARYPEDKQAEVLLAIQEYKKHFENLLRITFGNSRSEATRRNAEQLVLHLTSKIGGKKRRRTNGDAMPIMRKWALSAIRGGGYGENLTAESVLSVLESDQKKMQKARIPCKIVDYIRNVRATAELNANVPQDLKNKLNTLLTLVDPTADTVHARDDATLRDIELLCARKSSNHQAAALQEELGVPPADTGAEQQLQAEADAQRKRQEAQEAEEHERQVGVLANALADKLINNYDFDEDERDTIVNFFLSLRNIRRRPVLDVSEFTTPELNQLADAAREEMGKTRMTAAILTQGLIDELIAKHGFIPEERDSLAAALAPIVAAVVEEQQRVPTVEEFEQTYDMGDLAGQLRPQQLILGAPASPPFLEGIAEEVADEQEPDVQPVADQAVDTAQTSSEAASDNVGIMSSLWESGKQLLGLSQSDAAVEEAGDIADQAVAVAVDTAQHTVDAGQADDIVQAALDNDPTNPVLQQKKEETAKAVQKANDATDTTVDILRQAVLTYADSLIKNAQSSLVTNPAVTMTPDAVRRALPQGNIPALKQEIVVFSGNPVTDVRGFKQDNPVDGHFDFLTAVQNWLSEKEMTATKCCLLQFCVPKGLTVLVDGDNVKIYAQHQWYTAREQIIESHLKDINMETLSNLRKKIKTAEVEELPDLEKSVQRVYDEAPRGAKRVSVRMLTLKYYRDDVAANRATLTKLLDDARSLQDKANKSASEGDIKGTIENNGASQKARDEAIGLSAYSQIPELIELVRNELAPVDQQAKEQVDPVHERTVQAAVVAVRSEYQLNADIDLQIFPLQKGPLAELRRAFPEVDDIVDNDKLTDKIAIVSPNPGYLVATQFVPQTFLDSSEALQGLQLLMKSQPNKFTFRDLGSEFYVKEYKRDPTTFLQIQFIQASNRLRVQPMLDVAMAYAQANGYEYVIMFPTNGVEDLFKLGFERPRDATSNAVIAKVKKVTVPRSEAEVVPLPTTIPLGVQYPPPETPDEALGEAVDQVASEQDIELTPAEVETVKAAATMEDTTEPGRLARLAAAVKAGVASVLSRKDDPFQPSTPQALELVKNYYTAGIVIQKLPELTPDVAEKFKSICNARAEEVRRQKRQYRITGEAVEAVIMDLPKGEYDLYRIFPNGTNPDNATGYMLLSPYLPSVVYDKDIILRDKEGETRMYLKDGTYETDDRGRVDIYEDILAPIHDTYKYVTEDTNDYAVFSADPSQAALKEKERWHFGLEGLNVKGNDMYSMEKAYTSAPNAYKNIFELYLICTESGLGQPLQQLAMAVASDLKEQEQVKYLLLEAGTANMNTAMRKALVQYYSSKSVLQMTGPSKIADWMVEETKRGQPPQWKLEWKDALKTAKWPTDYSARMWKDIPTKANTAARKLGKVPVIAGDPNPSARQQPTVEQPVIEPTVEPFDWTSLHSFEVDVDHFSKLMHQYGTQLTSEALLERLGPNNADAADRAPLCQNALVQYRTAQRLFCTGMATAFSKESQLCNAFILENSLETQENWENGYNLWRQKIPDPVGSVHTACGGRTKNRRRTGGKLKIGEIKELLKPITKGGRRTYIIFSRTQSQITGNAWGNVKAFLSAETDKTATVNDQEQRVSIISTFCQFGDFTQVDNFLKLFLYHFLRTASTGTGYIVRLHVYEEDQVESIHSYKVALLMRYFGFQRATGATYKRLNDSVYTSDLSVDGDESQTYKYSSVFSEGKPLIQYMEADSSYAYLWRPAITETEMDNIAANVYLFVTAQCFRDDVVIVLKNECGIKRNDTITRAITEAIFKDEKSQLEDVVSTLKAKGFIDSSCLDKLLSN